MSLAVCKRQVVIFEDDSNLRLIVQLEKYQEKRNTYLKSSQNCDKYTETNEGENGRRTLWADYIFSSPTGGTVSDFTRGKN